MRLPWTKSKAGQLELLDADPDVQVHVGAGESRRAVQQTDSAQSARTVQFATANGAGHALLVPLDRLCEDPANPRTQFPEAEIDELADDIRQHGVLQPIVVHPADEQGQHRIHFGAKRWRAAQRAGLTAVPVVLRDTPTDPYTQVAENQKRHGLTPLDLARFIKGRVDAGASNAEIAKRLGMNLTTVAHHLALLELPSELDEALKSGRCTSPRTLHELSKLHNDCPNQVQELLASGSEITRTSVSALRAAAEGGDSSTTASSPHNKLITQANAACDRLERVLSRIRPSNSYRVALPELIALRIRVEDITKHWLQGSDRQTPSQTER
jgi:ParB family transcriptional regulator, chromosome partitioning protein